jgi:aryl-alcohol dehydrogenase-like predicted oxidoreductase
MQQIIIPNTNLKVSKLGFGTASLHYLLNHRAREKMLSHALDIGFTHFDTAPLYGEGLAELTLGNFLGRHRDQITLATKIGIPANPLLRTWPLLMYAQKSFSSLARRVYKNFPSDRKLYLEKNQVEESLHQSLKALRTDWIDVLFIHEPQITDILQLLEIVGWLQKQKHQGVVRYLGLAGTAQNCVEIATKIPSLFDIFQVEDSIENHEADIVVSAGFPLQITFGYLRKSFVSDHPIDPDKVIKKALVRNNHGMILVSSRSLERLKLLTSLA